MADKAIIEHKCKCDFCNVHKSLKQALESNDIEFVKDHMKKFAHLWANASNDADYYKCIFDGSWPYAEEVLTRALDRIKQINKEKAHTEFSKCCDCERTFRTVYFGTCKRCEQKTCTDCKTGLIQETRVKGTKKVLFNDVYSLCKKCSKELIR